MKVIGESNYFVKPCKTYLLRKTKQKNMWTWQCFRGGPSLYVGILRKLDSTDSTDLS